MSWRGHFKVSIMNRPKDYLIYFDGGMVGIMAFKNCLQAFGSIIVVLYTLLSPTRSVKVKANSTLTQKSHWIINLQWNYKESDSKCKLDNSDWKINNTNFDAIRCRLQ